MQTSDKKHAADARRPEEDSGVSVSIHWKRGGWALAAVLAALGAARLLGFI